jgi:sulfur carrier protein
LAFVDFPATLAAGNIHYNTVDGFEEAAVTSQRIEIVVNGETKKVGGELSVDQLLRELGIEAGRVAVELNRKIVAKRDWASTRVESGSQLEIVQFVGGG